MTRTREVELPHRWEWLFRGFRKYCVRYVRKHFHALRLSKTSRPLPTSSEPLLIVMNHPSWWDPLIAFVLSREMADREHYGAIDSRALRHYRFFKRLGFVGVDTTSFSGAAEFLITGEHLLSQSGRVYWVTAQGQFTDVRRRPLELKAGVGHLAARLHQGFVVPLAIEYCFWDERTPEALARFGEPLAIADYAGRSGKEWAQLIEDVLTSTLDTLNAEAVTRDPSKFSALVSGRTGIGGVYDLWRRFRSWLRGEKFDASHSVTVREERP
jgi:1-acyl-sn-glycerol-3-phosphate acyltransferase